MMIRVKRTPTIKSLIYRHNVTVQDNSKSTLTIWDMPHPKSLPLIGTKYNFMIFGNGTKLHEYVDLRHKQLGHIFYENLGGSSELVFISDPIIMRQLFLNVEGKYPMHILPEPWILYEKLYGSKRGLFFMNGKEWLENRRIMNKYLLQADTEQRIEKPVNDTIAKFILKLKSRVENEIFTPNLESEFYRLSVDVIVKVLLGTESPLAESKHYEELLERFSESVKKIFQTTTKLYGIPINICQTLNLKVWREFKESVDMSLLLAQKLVREMLCERSKCNGLIRKLSAENMSDEIITRIIADFVIAAGDTTAYTSLWILYLLSKNDAITKEIQTRRDSYEKYVVKEAMRLYPVAPFLTRILPKDSVLGPYRLNEGTPIIASIYTSGRDERNFSNADKFLPYRWDRNDVRKQELSNHVTSASFPFALGARSCIGKKIAMVQLTAIVRQIVDNFDFKCTNSTEVKAVTSQVLVPNQPIQISFRNK